MKKVLLLSLLIGLFIVTTVSFGHQPRIVSEEVTQIENPEVSQAFYAELKGKPDYYQIKSEEPFKLYVGILVPDLEGIDKDVSAEISREYLYVEETSVNEHEEEEARERQDTRHRVVRQARCARQRRRSRGRLARLPGPVGFGRQREDRFPVARRILL